MTIEPGQDAEPKRRKFDDVTSLFGPIVPVGNATSRFPPHRPAFIPLPPSSVIPTARGTPPSSSEAAPDPLPDLPPEQDLSSNTEVDEDLAGTVRITTTPPALSETRIEPTLPVRIDPPPPARPRAAKARRSAEIPWPDAFEPRPNYRRRQSTNWSWLLLIPAGLVAAAAITMIDARAARIWIDTTILHRTPVAGITESPLMPRPFRTPNTAKTETPAAGPPNPYPAIPTSPAPVAPGTEVSPPPPDPTNSTGAAAPIRVTIQYRRNIPGADGEARRLAALLQSYGGSVELHPNATTVPAATINYYNAADRDAATALASVLASEASAWLVRLGTTKNPPGTLDVWLP